jgi:hypothetical protein
MRAANNLGYAEGVCTAAAQKPGFKVDFVKDTSKRAAEAAHA